MPALTASRDAAATTGIAPPEPEVSPPEPEGNFKVGDRVIGIATKFKESFNDQECEVIAVLSKHYKVKMLTGPARNDIHKYYHAAVKVIHAQPAPLGESDQPDRLEEAPEQAPSSVDHGAAALTAIEDLFK